MWRNGRRARFRSLWELNLMQVQVLSSAPNQKRLFVFFSIQLMTGATEICDARYIGRHWFAFTLAIPSRSPRSLQVLSSAPKNTPFICGVFYFLFFQSISLYWVSKTPLSFNFLTFLSNFFFQKFLNSLLFPKSFTIVGLTA